MAEFDLRRRLAAETLGTAFLVATVVGSGIMAERGTQDAALALLANTLATAAILVVLVACLGPVSGAHFNPGVSLLFVLRGEMTRRTAALYALAQVAGGIAGTMAAQVMFGLPLLEASTKMRTGGAQWFAEIVAAFGLGLTILAARRFAAAGVAWLVALYIAAAYWFTSSTSFANPAVALARSLTDSFAGIRPVDVPAFALAEIAGFVLAHALAGWLLREPSAPARAEGGAPDRPVPPSARD